MAEGAIGKGEEVKIVIGVTTYGNLDRELGFLRSYWNNRGDSPHEIQLVCVDDGTPNPARVRERGVAVRRLNCDFISNGNNRGIPGSWNVILNYAKDKGAALCGIFNDDIRFVVPGFLERVVYFYEKNENVGAVGLPLINESGFTDSDPRWDCNPGLCGAAVGCSFFVRPEIALSVVNPDGSKGFFEALLSFHEETFCGFKMHELGFQSWMIPWPPAHHAGGQTFQANHELVWRDPVPGLPVEGFLNYVRSCQWYIPQYEEAYAQNKFDRMSYSRYLFCLYYGVLDSERYQEIDGQRVDCYEEPQRLVHSRVVKKKLDRLVFWMDRAGQSRSCEV